MSALYDRRLAAAQAVMDAAAKKMETWAGPCSACRWSRMNLFERRCDNPVVRAQRFSISHAYDAERAGSCNLQRGESNIRAQPLCGPDGFLFQPGLWLRFKMWAGWV